MEINHYFNSNRFYLLLRMELTRSSKAIGITLGILFGLFLLNTLLEPVFEHKKVFDSRPEDYICGLILGGYILSSLTFKDLGSNLKRYQYLALPASTFEKFLSMLLLSGIGWVFSYTLVFIPFSWVANFIGQLVFPRTTYMPFELLGKEQLFAIKFYLTTHSIFLVGATQFKKFIFPKTILTLLVIAVTFGIIAYLILSQLIPAEAECLAEKAIEFENMSVYQLLTVGKWLFWFFLAPVCWVVTYFGLKEKEV